MENKYIRYKFNGLTAEVYKWDCISLSPFLKEELRNKTAEREIIDAYLHSAECLYVFFRSENNPDEKIKVFRTNQMCMPFLFLCRHTIELSIKAVLNSKQGKIKKIHKLKELWEELKNEVNISNTDFDMLIDVLNIIDDDGCKLRYSNDGKGNNYNEKPCFVRADLILKTTKELYEFLLKQVS